MGPRLSILYMQNLECAGTSPLPMSTWNQELGDRLWPEPLGLFYPHSAKSTEGWSIRVSEGRKNLHMSDRDPSEARRTCAVCLQAPHLHGFLVKVKGLNRGSQGSVQLVKLSQVKFETFLF